MGLVGLGWVVCLTRLGLTTLLDYLTPTRLDPTSHPSSDPCYTTLLYSILILFLSYRLLGKCLLLGVPLDNRTLLLLFHVLPSLLGLLGPLELLESLVNRPQHLKVLNDVLAFYNKRKKLYFASIIVLILHL